jgi:hypothetical protein
LTVATNRFNRRFQEIGKSGFREKQGRSIPMKNFDWPGATLIALAAIPACALVWGIGATIQHATHGPDSCELRQDFTFGGESLVVEVCETWGNEMSRTVKARGAILLSDGTIYRLGGR